MGSLYSFWVSGRLIILECSFSSLIDHQETVVGEESLELVPHITLNPSFNIDMLEHIGEEDSR